MARKLGTSIDVGGHCLCVFDGLFFCARPVRYNLILTDLPGSSQPIMLSGRRFLAGNAPCQRKAYMLDCGRKVKQRLHANRPPKAVVCIILIKVNVKFTSPY